MRIKSGGGGRPAWQTCGHDGATGNGLFRRKNSNGGNERRERRQWRRMSCCHHRGHGGVGAEFNAVPLGGPAGTCGVRFAGYVHARHVHPRHPARGPGPLRHGGNRRIATAQHNAARPRHESHGDQCTAEQRGEQQCCKPPASEQSLGHFASHAVSLAQLIRAVHLHLISVSAPKVPASAASGNCL